MSRTRIRSSTQLVTHGEVALASAAPPPSVPGEVKSAVRTLQILELVAFSGGPLTLSEIASQLVLPVSSVHQLLRTLVGRGWLIFDGRSGAYEIGSHALFVGLNVLEHDPIVRAVKPQLALIQSELGETIHLARLDHARVVYLVSRESEHQLRTVSRAGQSLPAHATALGKAALSTLADEDVRIRLAQPLERPTNRTIANVDALLEDLSLVRARGWAIEREENTLGTGCLAVPISTWQGVYAISCSMPLTRLTDDRTDVVAAALKRAAESVELGISR